MMVNTPGLTRAGYDASDLTPGIVHFGVGNFHRSHQAMYLDRLIEVGSHNDWGIIGMGVMPGDIRMRDALAGQNYRYTLVEKSPDGIVSGREIGSIIGFVFAPENPQKVLDTLAQPDIRIVSLTITEGGYVVEPGNPTSVFGYLTEGLRIRRNRGLLPYTIMSCDNVPENGTVMKKAVLSYATALDPDLATWIEANVAFPNSMVDRITPVTTDADRELVHEQFGITDAWPVVTEPFTQWVLEDSFCNQRPAFERVGVQVVADVAPYEMMKLRLLNGSHQAMAYIGMLLGHTYVHEAVADADIQGFLPAYLAEAVPTLDPVPDIDPDSYVERLLERFGNPYIADTLARLADDASARIPKFILPTVQDNLTSHRSIRMSAAVIASWMHWLQVAGPGIVQDPLAAHLHSLAAEPGSFVRYEPVFGQLAGHRRVAEDVESLIRKLQRTPAREWLQGLLATGFS